MKVNQKSFWNFRFVLVAKPRGASFRYFFSKTFVIFFPETEYLGVYEHFEKD